MGTASSNVWFGKIITIFFIALLQAITLVSCNNKNVSTKPLENTTTSGTLKVVVDESFKPLLKTSAETFEALTPNADLTLEYIAQEQAISNLLEGKTDVVIAGRPLTEKEENVVRNRGLFPKINQIAFDGLVCIVSKKNLLKVVSTNELKDILSGKINTKIVCDKSNSSTLAFLQQKFKLADKISNIVGAGSDSAVIEYITTNPTAIGIIGMGLVCDVEDPNVKTRLDNVTLLSIKYTDSIGNTLVAQPTLDALANKAYPFIRPVYIINLDGSANLGSGFTNFMVSERAQRIVLKSGLLPYKLPTREILLSE